MTIIYFIAAFFSSWIWVDYFKLIGVSDIKKTKYLLITFILGASSFYLFNLINTNILDQFEFILKNKTLNHFLITATKIGLLGEVSKMIPVLIVYFLFRKKIKEPIDVFMFFSVAALGFSAGENLLYSFKNTSYFFNEKIILRTFGELFSSSLMAYGIIGYRFYHKHKKPLKIIILFFFAVLLHAFYDFWLDYELIVNYGFIITFLYFMFMISIYAIGLTNSLNVSSVFDSIQTIHSKEIIKTLFVYYLILIIAQFLVLSFSLSFTKAYENLENTIWFSGIIVVVMINRLTKLKKIKGRWEHVKLQLPFTFYKIDTFNGRKTRYKFKFQGEIFNEIFVDPYLNKISYMAPLSQRNSYIVKTKKIFIERKVYFKNDECFYLTRIVEDGNEELYLLKPKNSGKSLVRKKYPIVALLSVYDTDDLKNKNLTVHDFQFREWVFIKYH